MSYDTENHTKFMNTLLKNVCKVKMKSIPKVKGQKLAKTLVGVATDRGVLKDDSAAYAVFTERGSSASQMTVAKVMDVVARLPGCAGQAADAVSAYTQVKMEDAPRLFQIPKSECPDTWIRLPRHRWPKSWSDITGPAVLLERNLYGHPLVGLLWRDRQFEEVPLGLGWESTELRMPICSSKTRIVLIGIRGWHQNGWKNRIWLQCGRNWWNLLILTYQHHVSIMHIWDALNVNVNRTKTLSVNTRKCSNHEFLPLQLKNTRMGETSRKNCRVVLRHGRTC